MPQGTALAVERPDAQAIEDAVTVLLAAFDDPNREGLIGTPARIARMYSELLAPPELSFTTFGADGYDQMIIERDIPFYSLCEHHLVPFFGVAHVCYIPEERIVGISKLARTVEYYARRFQVQERMTQQIADLLDEKLHPKGVGVIIRARHLCQEMRGVKKHGVETITSALKGVLLRNQPAREEFLSLCRT